MEMGEWQAFKLHELGGLQRGRSRHRPRYAFHLYGGKYPFIQTGEIREAKKYVRNFAQTYNEVGLEQSKLWPKNTLCITIAANIAELAILSFDACFPDSVLGFTPDAEKANLDFIYYMLTFFQRELKHIGEGSVQDNINLGTFQDIDFFIPPLPEQRAIAAVLTSLDDKIDLLHRQNKTLEAMAETLFRQWFVEEVGEDWEDGELGDIAQNIRVNVDAKSISDDDIYIGLEHIERRHIAISKYGYGVEVSSNKSRFQRSDILFGKLRPYFHKVCIAQFDGVCSTDILVIRAKSDVWTSFSLFAFFQDDVVEYANLASGGTRMPRADWKYLSQYPLAIPPIQLVAKFESIVRPSINKIFKNLQQIQTLEKLRDNLLPKLMSGEVRVDCALR